VKPSIDKTTFAVLARRSGVPLTDDEITTLYEGYGLLEQIVAELDRPVDAALEPALIFVPERASCCR
jgi:hypothetical protein